MRLFSDGGRGSGAIKGYCDVIVAQEWFKDGDDEIIHWGAFGKNTADLDPRTFVPTSENSGLWVPAEIDGLSQTVMASLRLLKAHNPELIFDSQAEAADRISRARGLGRSTANEHVKLLSAKGLG